MESTEAEDVLDMRRQRVREAHLDEMRNRNQALMMLAGITFGMATDHAFGLLLKHDVAVKTYIAAVVFLMLLMAITVIKQHLAMRRLKDMLTADCEVLLERARAELEKIFPGDVEKIEQEMEQFKRAMPKA